MRVKRDFAKYVSLNILGMIGMSCYFMADTYFISRAQGSNGITALNLVLPVYGLIYAIGAMIGVGSAIRFSIAKASGQEDKDKYLFNAVFFTTLLSLGFIAAGLLAPEGVMRLLGADDVIAATGREYTRIFMGFAPFFMWSITANAFVRNDGSPIIAMISTLASSLFNIAFDYVLMFPLGMGMKGAALATALSPLLGVLICCTHFLTKKCTLTLKPCMPSLGRLLFSCRVGVSAFISELSSGVITLVFNFIILSVAGNTAIAAYGIIANAALVAVSAFNGIANGSQPLISYSYGAGEKKSTAELRRLSIVTALLLAAVMYAAAFAFTDRIIAVFNSEGSAELYGYAHRGIRLYFTGIFFAGVNAAGASFLSATERARSASIVSVLRGLIMIALFAVLLSSVLGIDGVWLSYAAGEGFTTIVMLVLFASERHKKIKNF